MNYNFLILGGDKRIVFLAKGLAKEGNIVYTYGNKIEEITEIDKKENIKNYKYDIVISSMPLTKDYENIYSPLSNKNIKIDELKELASGKILIAGKFPNNFEIEAEKNNIKCYDILNDEVTTILNTIPTAEGALQVAMEETNYTLTGKKALILGFGRVGKVLANKLAKFGLDIYCEARKENDLAWIRAYGYKDIKLEDMKNHLCKMNIIFNTIPTKILDKSTLILLNKNTVIIDLASAPGGVDYEVANKLGIKAILASALPGKVAPLTTAEYLQEFVKKVIK